VFRTVSWIFRVRDQWVKRDPYLLKSSAFGVPMERGTLTFGAPLAFLCSKNDKEEPYF
jgi:hypothetical protein